jgi:hypothetical protein
MLRRICFLTCSLVLNQDLQDFEDFLVLGVGIGMMRAAA